MRKYSYEFKKQVVQEYIEGKGGYKSLARKHKIPSKTRVEEWVKAYKAFGNKGLMSTKKKYTFEFKLSVVELYLTTEATYQEVALRVGMNHPSAITRWVNAYRISGPEAFRKKSKGREPLMPKPKKIKSIEDNAKYLEQLEADNLHLRIENAYLKELRRLRLEEEALNKRRELLVASEENSN